MQRENWDDLRFVLAVAEEGTVSGAARVLGVNHATVLRRIAAFEQATGVEIFDKTARGYVVPDAHRRVIDATREVDRAVQAVGRMIHGARAPVSGDIRVTATDSLCQMVMPRVLSRLGKTAPGLRIELISSNLHVDLARSQADVTIRPAQSLPDDLRGERAGLMGFALYRAKGSGTDRWLEPSGPLARSVAGRWVAGNVDPSLIAGGADSFMVLRELCAAGQGQAILPFVVGAGDPRLIAVPGVVPRLRTDLWIASHVDLYDIPRIRAARTALCEALEEEAAALQGAD